MDNPVDLPNSITSHAKANAIPPNRVRSEALLRGGKELVIAHNGREYRLRLTQSGKLILTA